MDSGQHGTSWLQRGPCRNMVWQGSRSHGYPIPSSVLGTLQCTSLKCKGRIDSLCSSEESDKKLRGLSHSLMFPIFHSKFESADLVVLNEDCMQVFSKCKIPGFFKEKTLSANRHTASGL